VCQLESIMNLNSTFLHQFDLQEYDIHCYGGSWDTTQKLIVDMALVEKMHMFKPHTVILQLGSNAL